MLNGHIANGREYLTCRQLTACDQAAQLRADLLINRLGRARQYRESVGVHLMCIDILIHIARTVKGTNACFAIPDRVFVLHGTTFRWDEQKAKENMQKHDSLCRRGNRLCSIAVYASA